MLMDLIKARHSIRKYKDDQIPLEDLRLILDAGNYAPNAGGGQRSMMVAVHDKDLTTRIGIMNLERFDRSRLAGSFVSKEQPSSIDDPTMKNGFYGAPSVICIFGQDNFLFREADAFCIAENMILQATELGIASCIISRGAETFVSKEGQSLVKSWDIPDNYSAVCFVILGYIDGAYPRTKPRKAGRVKVVDAHGVTVHESDE